MDSRPTLSEIGAHFNTDKGPAGHNYLSMYEPYFAPLRNQPIKLLEIGVQHGASMKTWEAYFPNAIIVGLDCEVHCLEYQTDRIHTYHGDAAMDKDFVSSVIDKEGPFDIVLDDGSHHGYQQIASFEMLYPHVKPGGLYIVEDVHTSFWNKQAWPTSYLPQLHDQIDHVLYPCPEVFTDCADRRNSPHWAMLNCLLTPFERVTKAIHLYAGFVLYLKWAEGERY